MTTADTSAFIFTMMLFLFASLFFLVDYVLSGIAYMKLTKARGMEYPWLAWIPIANSYQIGKVSDHINADYNNKTNRGITMLVLNIISAVSGFILTVMLVPFFSVVITALVDTDMYPNYDQIGEEAANILISSVSIIMLLSLVLMAVTIWLMVLKFMSWYAVFKEYAPESAGIYLAVTLICHFILSITFVAPIVILLICKKTPQFQLLNSRSTYNYQDPYNNPINPNDPGNVGGPNNFNNPNNN